MTQGAEPSLGSICASLREDLCRSWCDDLAVDQQGTVAVVRLPMTWPNGETVCCYVEEKHGALFVSDWGTLHAELFLLGIHGSKLLDTFARALGFSFLKHEELVKHVHSHEDVVEAVRGIWQLSAAAVAEATSLHFLPPAMIITSAWENALRKNLKERPGLRLVAGGEDHRVFTGDLFERAPVAVFQDAPVLVAPYVSGQKGSLAKLYYFSREGVPTVKGIVPLVRVAWSDAETRRLLRDVERACRETGREFVPVEIRPGDEQFSEKLGTYPALDAMTKGSTAVDDVLDKILSAGTAA